MAIDVHIHLKGHEDGNRILKAMDEAGITRMVLISKAPPRSFSMGPSQLAEEPAGGFTHREVLDNLAQIVAPDKDRLLGFAWIEPTLSDAQWALDYALGEKELAGVKMMPYHWYPSDERAQAIFAGIETHRKPLLVHTGALWGFTDSSQFCKPMYMEVLLRYPGVRVALAHIGWPWTDECLAVGGKFRAAASRDSGRERNCFIEISSGAPRIWKVDALRKALAYLGDDRLIYGSDLFEAEDPARLRQYIQEEISVLQEAGALPETIERIMSRNALTWLGLPE
jgi:predicted TIM-barrel fold metal-dependent hydrolase